MRAALLAFFFSGMSLGCAERRDAQGGTSPTLTYATPLSLVRAHRALANVGRERVSNSAITLPAQADAETSFVEPRHPSATLRVRALEVGAGSVERDDQALVFHDVAPSTDLILSRASSGFEELRVLRDPAAPTHFSWSVSVDGSAANARVREGLVEVRDERGQRMFFAARPWAIDVSGRRVDLDVSLSNDAPGRWTLRASLDPRGLRYPIVVDPTWSAEPKMDQARVRPAFAFVTGGLLVTGGPDATNSSTDSASMMDTSTFVWTAFAGTNIMRSTRNWGSMIPVPIAGGLTGALIVGGTDDVSEHAEIYDPTSTRFRKLGGTQPASSRSRFTIDPLPDGRYLVVGGTDYAGHSLSSAEYYDPKTESFSPAPSLMQARIQPASLVLDCGDILVAGGYVFSDAGSPTPVATAERFVAATAKWVPAGTLGTPRWGSGLVPLPSGKAMLPGGGDYVSQYSTTEVWDANTNVWTEIVPMDVARYQVTPVVGNDGKVLVAAGVDGADNTVATTSIYDPATGKWSAGPPLKVPQNFYSVAPLPGGALMFFGGENALTPIDSVEIWDAGGSVASPPRAHCPGSDAGTDAATGDAFDGSADAVSTDGSATDSGGASDGASDSGSAPSGDGGVAATSFTSCDKDGDCQAGRHCVDHVCCDTTCTDRCYSCRLPGAVGTCLPQPSGLDLKASCGATGNCDSTCDGRGGCRATRGGEQCAPAACTSATQLRGPASCTAAGAACPTPTQVYDCSPYVCESSLAACLINCRSSADCASGYACDLGKNQCVASAGSGSGGCNVVGSAAPAPVGLMLGTLGTLGALALLRRRGTR